MDRQRHHHHRPDRARGVRRRSYPIGIAVTDEVFHALHVTRDAFLADTKRRLLRVK
jgi:hypothetical protein